MIERRVMRLTTPGLLCSLAVAACSSGTGPHFRPCTVADTQITLAVNQPMTIDPAIDGGCMVFPATASAAAEYLLIPQLTSGVPGQTAGFRLVGDTILPAPVPSSMLPASSAAVGAAEAFHTFLRLGDERRSWGFAPEPGTGIQLPRSIAVAPPAMGSLRTFEVCAKTDCSRFNKVGARVRATGNKVVIYIDTLAPSGGLDSVALDSIARVFDQQLYPVDTAAFGRESDIDSNSVVMVLMTNTVNKLVTKTQCNQSGFIAGFFFGLDIDPAYRNDSRSNKGEIFYSIVADPMGTLSCPHTATDVEKFVPVTFIHEFQHMISFNQHVLVHGTGGEVLWLNEGLSHYAEELGGRSYAAVPDGTVTDCTSGTTECRFYAGDLIDAYQYMDSVTAHFLLPTAGIGSLAERGAAWMFVRYVVDQYAAGNTMAAWNVVTRSLDGTAQTGAQNIATVTGTPFETVVTRWALALDVTDRAGIPSYLQYASWNFHAVYAALHTRDSTTFFKSAYPLVPLVFPGRGISLGGTLRAGSGIYIRATQPPGDPGFTISFTAPNGAPINSAFGPRLTVMRLQ
ncbi:MAG TPA: hypothetical protein VE714_10225 [Gemmatimonadales bacterium]|nr:hypothetical protein [Gemmatimonadales bacterium]